MADVRLGRVPRSHSSLLSSKSVSSGPVLGDFWTETAAFLADFDGADVAEQERQEDIQTAKQEWNDRQARRAKRKRTAQPEESRAGPVDEQPDRAALATGPTTTSQSSTISEAAKRRRVEHVERETSGREASRMTLEVVEPASSGPEEAPDPAREPKAASDAPVMFDEPDNIMVDDPQPLDDLLLPNASAQSHSHPSPPPKAPSPAAQQASQPSQSATPQPLTRTGPAFLPRHLTSSVSTPSGGPSLSYLTNVTTPGDTSASDATPGPPIPLKKPRRTKSAESRQPEHIRRMLERKESLARAREEEEARAKGAVQLEEKTKNGKGKEKAKTHWDFAERAERLNAALAAEGKAVATRQGGSRERRLFDGCVFYMVWDMEKLVTKKHTDWLEKASALGAVISTDLDLSVTHVISLSKFKRAETFKKLKCQTLFDIMKGPEYVNQTWFEQSEKTNARADEQEHQTFFELRKSQTIAGGPIDLTRDEAAPPAAKHSPMREKNKRTFQTSSDSFHIPGFGPQPTFSLNAPSEHNAFGMSSANTLREMAAMKAEPSRPEARTRDSLDEMIEGMMAGEVDEDVHLSEGEDAGEEGMENEGARERKMWSPIGLTTDLPPSPRREPSPSKVTIRYLSEAEINEMDTDEEEEYERSKAQLPQTRKSRREDLEARGGVFQCQRSNPGRKEGPNEHIAKRFEQMGDLLKAQTNATQRDFFRSRSYAQIAGILRNHPVAITSAKQAVDIRGIGTKQANKIAEILETGTCTRLELELANPKTVAAQLFSGIYGIGVTRGNQLYDLGARTLDDLRADPAKYHLTPANQIGLTLYDDLQLRIPRDEVTALFKRVEAVVLEIDPDMKLQPMGSYRRGGKDCGDIDILMTRDTEDGKDHKGVLDKALRALRANGFLQHDLANPRNAFDLEAKYMGICRLSPDLPMRRIDILTIPREEYGAALIYFTGNDIFNRSMRLLANKKGFSLNQRSLSKNVARNPQTREKVTAGEVVASREEEDIFRVLGVTWRAPEERIC